jgi:hypothetical protein
MLRFLLTIAAVLVASSAVSLAQAKFEVEGGETYDWGKVKPPTAGYLEGTIKMKNAGKGGLIKLIEIKPGCGCTKTDPDKLEMTAGEVSSMNVKLNISPSQNGMISKSITVRYTDGVDTTTTWLHLRADIQRAVTLSPQNYYSFTDMRIGAEATASVTVANNGDNAITFSEFTADNGLVLNVNGKRTLKPGEKFDLVIKTIPSKSGSFGGKVSFATDHPDHATIDMPVYGHVMESTSPVFQKETK